MSKHAFLPLSGSSASGPHLHAFLIDGVMRWNEDRRLASMTPGTAGKIGLYSSSLTAATNLAAQQVFGRDLIQGVAPIPAYTGEKMGLDYLLDQVGQPLDIHRLSREIEDGMSDEEVLQDLEDEEGSEIPFKSQVCML